MKSIAGLLVILGVATIVLGFMDKVPRVMEWVYEWGDGAAWAIKIGLVVAGAALYYVASRQKKAAPAEEATGN